MAMAIGEKLVFKQGYEELGFVEDLSSYNEDIDKYNTAIITLKDNTHSKIFYEKGHGSEMSALVTDVYSSILDIFPKRREKYEHKKCFNDTIPDIDLGTLISIGWCAQTPENTSKATLVSTIIAWIDGDI